MTQHTFTVQDIRTMTDAEIEGVLDRLHHAETICVLYGWTGTNQGRSERDDALTELWLRWFQRVGDDFVSPGENPELSDSVISDLARARNRKRDATLKHYFGDTDGGN